MTASVERIVKSIDDRVSALKEEISTLESARKALGRTAGTGSGRTGTGSVRKPRRRARSSASVRQSRQQRSRRSGSTTRAHEAARLVRSQPGITVPEIAAAMKIKPNYLYQLLPKLASAGEVRREGRGWHPAE